MIDFPAPVSPLMTLKLGCNDIDCRSIIAKLLIVSSESIVPHVLTIRGDCRDFAMGWRELQAVCNGVVLI